MLAQNSQSVTLVLLTIDHEDFEEPVHLVNDKVPLVRGNLLTFSEQLDNAAWTKTGTTVTADARIAPDGATTADRVVAIGGTLNSAVGRTDSGILQTGLNPLTFSSYVAEDTGPYIGLYFRNETTLDELSVMFTWTNGVLGSGTTLRANGVISASTGVERLTNGWYRPWIKGSLDSTTGDNLTTALLVTLDNSVDTYGAYLWGAQLVTGSRLPAYSSTTTTSSSIDSFEALPFELSLPNDLDSDELPTLQLMVDNVGRRLVAPLRTVTTPPSVSVEIVSLLPSGKIVTDIGPMEFSMTNIEMDAQQIRATIAYEADYLNMAATKAHFDPSVAPALF